MPLRRHIVAAGVLLALGAAVQPAAADVIAVVNGEPISRADFGLALVQSLGRSVMNTFVDRALVEQEARRLGIGVTDAELAERRELEVDLRLRAVPTRARMGPHEFRTLATLRGWDMAEFRRQIERGISDGSLRVLLLAEKMLVPRLDLSDEALRTYYERTRGRRCVAAHIVVGGRRAADRLLATLRDKPELWTQVVLQASLDRGSVPYKGRIGPVPADSDLGRALSGMQPGELKAHQQGELWQILRFIREVPPADEPFDQMRDRLRAELIVVECRTAFDALLAFLNQQSTVVVNLSSDERVRRLLGEETAAFVNGEPLALSDLADALVEEFGPKMLEPYVERTLLTQEARRRGVTVSEEAFEARLKAIGEQLFGEQAAQRDIATDELADLLTKTGVGVADFKEELVQQFASAEDVRATLLAEKMVEEGVEVSENDIVDAYRELRTGRLVVKELSADTSDAAELLRRKISQGADFDLVARTELSEPGTWVTGSLTRIVTSSHPYYLYVKDLAVGEVSVVFEHAGKYRIIKLLRRHFPSDPPPLEAVRDSLEQEVRLRKARARIQALLVKLKAESDVEITLN
jgi:parvulin-like peptidyl-prolyl isomerase